MSSIIMLYTNKTIINVAYYYIYDLKYNLYFYECAGGGTFGTVQFQCDRDPSEIVHGTIQKQIRWAPSNLLTNY